MFKKAKFVAISLSLLVVGLVSTAQAEPPANAQGYWDNDAMRNARPIELQFDRKTGVGQLVTPTASIASPASFGTVSGTDWTYNKLPQTAVGKIFFTSGGLNYVCSGALVTDNTDNQALVLTAGHCVIDKGTFVKNFMFVPNYDDDIKDGSIDPANKWYASNLVVRTEFATAKQFNTTAIQHDWAFAVLPTGKFSKDKKSFTNGATAPDVNGNSFDLVVSAFTSGNTSTAFGYPAASPYTGQYLIYASNAISTDTTSVDQTLGTWGMGSTLTGGASGGPWLSALSSDYKVGNVSSLNSYKYTNDTTRMYGPKFGAKTTSTYTAALSANTVSATNVIVSG